MQTVDTRPLTMLTSYGLCLRSSALEGLGGTWGMCPSLEKFCHILPSPAVRRGDLCDLFYSEQSLK